MDFTKKWVTHLRNNHKQETTHTLRCSLCATELPNEWELFRSHVDADLTNHAAWDSEEAIKSAFENLRANRKLQSETHFPHRPQKRPTPAVHDANDPNSQTSCNILDSCDEQMRSRKRRSPSASSDQSVETSASSPSIRSRARNPSSRALWVEGDTSKPEDKKGRSPPVSNRTSRQQPRSGSAPNESQSNDDAATRMMLQPETRPISQDQLVAEVKGIYAGLVMVETKCIEVDNAQSSNTDANKLNSEQWQALIALHRTLLHEHHDFFLASQHPSASAPLRRLASKYAMPARMWRHGIHSFLELLRHRLPASLEHMLTFLYLAYSMMALLYETVPAFEDTWIECLGDLGRYRMAIEDDDIRDREVWTGVSRHWYSKASDKSPTTGRLYHHLAILARPNALQQLYYYTKSLCVPIPFLNAKESIMTLFDPVLSSDSSRLSPFDAAYVHAHKILFSGNSKVDKSEMEFLESIDSHISRTTKRWLEEGYFIGISLACTLLEYGDKCNPSMSTISQPVDDADSTTENIEIQSWGDTDILPFVHTILVFLRYLDQNAQTVAHIEEKYPWKLASILLNYLYSSFDFELGFEGEFPGLEKEEIPRPLPEDYTLRGLAFAEEYYPKSWFVSDNIDEDEKYFELASMIDERDICIVSLDSDSSNKGGENYFDTPPFHEKRSYMEHEHPIRHFKGTLNCHHNMEIDSSIAPEMAWFNINPTVMAY